MGFNSGFKGLNPICHLLALLGAHLIHHVSRVRANDNKWYLQQYVVRKIPQNIKKIIFVSYILK